MYLQKNTTHHFQLEDEICNLKQFANQGISDFFSQLEVKWEQYYLMLPEALIASADFKKYIEENKLFYFLHGLHDDFEYIRCNIWNRTPLPTVAAVIPE